MLRVLSANLYNGRADPASLARLLDEMRPDVVAAQELAPNAAEVIADRLPHGLVSPALDHTGSAIAARFPLEVRRIPLPHRGALVAQESITIWCVHLANPVDAPPPLRKRRQQVLTLESKLRETTGPTLLVGDLNSTPVWPAYRRLTTLLDDGVAEWACRTGRRPRRTWGYRPWMPAMLRIDHALVRDVKVQNCQVRRITGADHRALIVDVV